MSTSAKTASGSALYKQLAEFPTYQSAQFQASNVLRVATSHVDHTTAARRTTLKTFVLAGGATYTSIVPDAPEMMASALSPSGKYLAVLRVVSDSAAPDRKKRFVEVWSDDRIKACKEVTDLHGPFYTDEYLYSISFSPSESRIVYTAEANPIDSSETDSFAKFRFVPDFGESYFGKKNPSVFLFDWKQAENPIIAKISLRQPHSSPALLGHAVFGEEDTIFAVSYEYSSAGRILGVIHCPNRSAGIWEIRLPQEVKKDNDDLKCPSSKLTSSDMSCRSPRVLPATDGRPALLIWVANAVGGPHATCSSIYVKDLSSGKVKVLVANVWDPKPSEFPGLYLNTLPTSPFLTHSSGTSYIVLSSFWRSRTTILLISLDDGSVKNLTPDDDLHYSWTMLGTDGKNQLVCTRSAPSRPPELLLGQVDDKHHNVDWQSVARPNVRNELQQQLDALKSEIIPIPDRYPTETLLLRRTQSGTLPCVTMPHGGPHSCTSTTFNAWSAAFAIEGYAVSAPNYTGSIGFGEKYVTELLGKIGSLDIGDCIASIHHLASLGVTELGPGKQYLMGGSHGGFIIGHVIGQYPGMFSGAVMRNPVISLGEVSYSDIPDWYYEESGVQYHPDTIMTPEIYQKVFPMSPIAYVDAVRTPVILLLGEKDMRVATTQGKGYYYALKSRGKDVAMLCFKDDIHSIDSVDGSRITYEAARRLFTSRHN